jgi:hypothetical protein
MEIWNGGRQHACVSGYQRTGDIVKIWWKGTWDLCLEPRVVEAWKKVAREQTRHELVIEIGQISAGDIKRHGDAIGYLVQQQQVCSPLSLFQIQREKDTFYYP